MAHGFLGAAAEIVDDDAAAGFFFGDFGFFCSRLLRFCPLAMALPSYLASIFRRVGC